LDLILGIDPGTSFCGWALLTVDGNLYSSGCISVGTKLGDYKLRMVNISNTVEGLLSLVHSKGHRLVMAGIESQYVANNPNSVMILSRLTGSLMMSIYRVYGIIAEDIAPESAKKVFGVKSHDYKNLKRKDKRKALDNAMKEAAEREFGKKINRADEAFAMAIAKVTLNIYNEAEDIEAV